MALGLASRAQVATDEDLLSACLRSCAARDNVIGISNWLLQRAQRDRLVARPTPLDSLAQWHFDSSTGFHHASGKFFSISGLRAELASARSVRSIEQPIIHQPEVGVLGFIAKVSQGVLWLLAQCKDEPGNVSGPQLSPTVQATFSNYTRVHGGRAVPYVDRFLEDGAGLRVFSQVQPEHGRYFAKKRNLNALMLVDDVELESERFRWVTLGELFWFLKRDFGVSMDARSVLSCLLQELSQRFAVHLEGVSSSRANSVTGDGEFAHALRTSMFMRAGACHSDEWLKSWLNEQRATSSIRVTHMPLGELSTWSIDPLRVYSGQGHFHVAGFSVRAPFRERDAWSQPLFCQNAREPSSPGARPVIGFVCQRIRSRLHFLCRSSLEPGEPDHVCIAPTVVSRGEGTRETPFQDVALEDWLFDSRATVRLSANHSEEGGRFFRFVHEHRVVELPEEVALDAPPGFAWLTLNQIYSLMASQRVTIEARNLLACLDPGEDA
ncbi:MAG TPA: NDP-hexose 2,3-dehydratase family protein [Polyangiaceae bacterium]|nr:NDP-hexose 2,3-dehydratase family protein [Polyangiaceae bacterium]